MNAYDLLVRMTIFQTATATAVVLLCLYFLFKRKYLVLHGVLFLSALYHSVVICRYTYAIVPDLNLLNGRFYLWYLIRTVLYCACLISGGLLLRSSNSVVVKIHYVGTGLVILEMALTLFNVKYIGP